MIRLKETIKGTLDVQKKERMKSLKQFLKDASIDKNKTSINNQSIENTELINKSSIEESV